VARWLRRIALALLFSLLAGLAIGTALRVRMSRPTIYIGDARASAPAQAPQSGARSEPKASEVDQVASGGTPSACSRIGSCS